MQIINNYNETENRVCIHIETEYLVDISRPLKIVAYVTEDSISGYQKNTNSSAGTTPEITNYIFMNVLRGAVNGTWGAILSNSPITTGTKKISSYALNLNSNWKAQHCYIVALVYYDDTDEIIMAAKAKVKL